MDQAEFRLRFNLHPLAKQDPAALPHQGLRKAAVLIPLQEIRGELNLILTQRPMHLRAHPGQISFPGGKIEASDPSAIIAALREAEEEIGLCRENVDVIGTFPAHNTFTGFEIIGRVPAILHTPLMSGSNFIHGIVVVGALWALLNASSLTEQIIGFVGVLLGAGNAAGGYVVTERMLQMFKPSSKTNKE